MDNAVPRDTESGHKFDSAPDTQRVRGMYRSYPFPYEASHALPTWLPGPVRRWLVPPRGRSYARRLQKMCGERSPSELRLLDAGCGTGEITSTVAGALPWKSVTAVDVTDRSLELAEALAQRNQLDVDFHRADLMNLAALRALAGERGFDAILSVGVVHHVPDPAAALRNLAEVLAPDGFFLLYVWAHPGRADVRRIRSIVTSLVPDEDDFDGRLAALHQLGHVRPYPRPVRGWFLERLGVSTLAMRESRAVDDYIHACAHTMTAVELMDAVEGAGLEVTHWFRGIRENFDGLLDDEAARQAESLPREERLRLMDDLLLPRAYVVGLRRR